MPSGQNGGGSIHIAIYMALPYISPWKVVIENFMEPNLLYFPFPTPCNMRFFPRDTGKMATLKLSSQSGHFSLYRVGKIAYRRGQEIGAH